MSYTRSRHSKGPTDSTSDRQSTSTRESVTHAGAILLAIAVVLAAGTVVGQAPVLFGAVDDEPDASIEVSNQTGDGASIDVDRVNLSAGGFVVVTNENGTVVGVSSYLDAGGHENVTVERRANETVLGHLTATVHRDTRETRTFDYLATDGEEDVPYTSEGEPVSDEVVVVAVGPEDDPTRTTSFVVSNLSVPANASANETVPVSALVANPNAVEANQHVELRLDGEVIDRRVISLQADESQEVRFELEDVDPGSHDVGVFTTDDGVVEQVVVESDDSGTEPSSSDAQ